MIRENALYVVEILSFLIYEDTKTNISNINNSIWLQTFVFSEFGYKYVDEYTKYQNSVYELHYEGRFVFGIYNGTGSAYCYVGCGIGHF